MTDQTSIDGKALSTTTTDYSFNLPPFYFVQVQEDAGGTEGNRTTTTTYNSAGDRVVSQTGGINPYTIEYDDNDLISHYTCGSWDYTWVYDAQTVTCTKKFNGTTVETATTAYSPDMATETTTVNDAAGALPSIVEYYPGDDTTNPWGLKAIRGADGSLQTFAYKWNPSTEFQTTIDTGGSSDGSLTVGAGTRTITLENPAGQIYSTVTTDITSGVTLASKAVSSTPLTSPPFPLTFKLLDGKTESYTYDGEGQVLTHKDELGHTTTYTRDALNRVTSIKRDPLTWAISYNSGGHLGYTATCGTRSIVEQVTPFGSQDSFSDTGGAENLTVTRTETSSTVTTVTHNTTTSRTSTEAFDKGTLTTTETGNAVGLNGGDKWTTTWFPFGSGWDETVTNDTFAGQNTDTTCDPLGWPTLRESTGDDGNTLDTGYGYTGGRLSEIDRGNAAPVQIAYAADGSVNKISEGTVRYVSVTPVGPGLGYKWSASGRTGEVVLWNETIDPQHGKIIDTPLGLPARAITTTRTVGVTADDVESIERQGPGFDDTLSWKDGTLDSGTIQEGSVTGGFGTAPRYPSGELKEIDGNAGALTNTKIVFSELGLPTSYTPPIGTATTITNSFDGDGNFTAHATTGDIDSTIKTAPSGMTLASSGFGQVDATWALSPGPNGGFSLSETTSAGSSGGTMNPSGTSLSRYYPDHFIEFFTRTPEGALASSTLPGYGEVDYQPNAFKEPTQVGNEVYSIVPDNAGYPQTVRDQAGTHTLTYTIDGKLLTESLSGGPLDGQSVTNTYDDLGLPHDVTPNGGSTMTSSATDAGEVYQITAASGQSITYGSYDSIAGRPLNLYAGPLTVTNAYDAKGRTTSVSNHISGGANANYSVTYGAHDRVASQNTPFGNWTYYYDGGDGKGFLHRAIRSDGVTFTYNWDSAGRPTSHVGNDYYATSRGNPSSVVVAGTMAAGLGTSTVKVTNPTTNTTAAYPTVNATTGAFSTSYTGLSGWQTFDIIGTIAAAGMNGTDAKAEQVRQIFVPPTTETLSVDNAGNLTGDAMWTYTWNDIGQQIWAVQKNPPPNTSAMTIGYIYDWRGRRIQKTVFAGPVTTHTTYLWDNWLLIREIQYDGNNAEVLRRTYTWGPDVSGRSGKAGGVGGLVEIYQQPAGGTATTTVPFYDCDGDLVGAIDKNSGAKVADFQYGPFGELISASGPMADSIPFRFRTKYYDAETGDYYWGKRFYSPRDHMWASRDGRTETGDGANTNWFLRNNPLGHWDAIGNATNKEIVDLTLEGTPGLHLDDDDKFFGSWERPTPTFIPSSSKFADLSGSSDTSSAMLVGLRQDMSWTRDNFNHPLITVSDVIEAGEDALEIGLYAANYAPILAPVAREEEVLEAGGGMLRTLESEAIGAENFGVRAGYEYGTGIPNAANEITPIVENSAATRKASKQLASSLFENNILKPTPFSEAAHIVPTTGHIRNDIEAVRGFATAQVKMDLYLPGFRNNAINGFWAEPGHLGTHTDYYYRALGLEFKDVNSADGIIAALQNMRTRILSGEFIQ